VKFRCLMRCRLNLPSWYAFIAIAATCSRVCWEWLAGKWKYVGAVAKAGIAAGADGLLVEVHPAPDEALSDGPQSLTFEQFSTLMDDVRRLTVAFQPENVAATSQLPR